MWRSWLGLFRHEVFLPHIMEDNSMDARLVGNDIYSVFISSLVPICGLAREDSESRRRSPSGRT